MVLILKQKSSKVLEREQGDGRALEALIYPTLLPSPTHTAQTINIGLAITPNSPVSDEKPSSWSTLDSNPYPGTELTVYYSMPLC